MQLYLPLFYALIGMVIGSFLNVCIYRIPRGESVAFPRSRCPHCEHPIRPYDNIPVLSYLLLRGKCRSCGRPISVQYPLVELLSGLAFYYCGAVWEFTSPTYVNSLFLSVIIILVFIDYHHQILPNILTLPGIIAGILLSPLQTTTVYADRLSWNACSLFGAENVQGMIPWAGSVLGAVIGGGTLFIVAFTYELIRRKQGLGMGDVKMIAMVGAFLGWRLTILTIFAGSFLGSILGVLLILSRKMNFQSKLAFGVFLGIGAVFSLFFGLPLIHWYLGNF